METKEFWQNVEASSKEECWPWVGFIESHGYGRLRAPKGRLVLAHRVAYEKANGCIPEGMCVCHRCDTKECCNPDHLFLGSQSDNMKDMKNKGRARSLRGEKSPRSKLTQEMVDYIRTSPNAKILSGVELAMLFDVGKATVYDVRNNRTWTA